MSEAKVVLEGLGIPESPRWRDGRLWFANWIGQQIIAFDPLTAETETVDAPTEQQMGWSIEWLPDGRMLATGDELRRREPDGSWVVHAENAGGNEIVVDGRGNVYTNGQDFDFSGGEEFKPGFIKLVTPDGTVQEVATEIRFPNGMVVTPDDKTLIVSESFAGELTAFDIDDDGGLSNRRTFAADLGPDGICLDAEGAVWVSTGGSSVVRVAEGGEILQTIEIGEHRAPFALALGGSELFVMTAEWHLDQEVGENLGRLREGPRTGQVLAYPVDVPGVR